MEDVKTAINPYLLRQNQAYMAKWKAKGKHSLTYTAPCCGVTEETPAPDNNREKWDTLCLCPHCGLMYMKVTVNDLVVTHMPKES